MLRFSLNIFIVFVLWFLFIYLFKMFLLPELMWARDMWGWLCVCVCVNTAHLCTGRSSPGTRPEPSTLLRLSPSRCCAGYGPDAAAESRRTEERRRKKKREEEEEEEEEREEDEDEEEESRGLMKTERNWVSWNIHGGFLKHLFYFMHWQKHAPTEPINNQSTTRPKELINQSISGETLAASQTPESSQDKKKIKFKLNHSHQEKPTVRSRRRRTLSPGSSFSPDYTSPHH